MSVNELRNRSRSRRGPAQMQETLHGMTDGDHTSSVSSPVRSAGMQVNSNERTESISTSIKVPNTILSDQDPGSTRSTTGRNDQSGVDRTLDQLRIAMAEQREAIGEALAVGEPISPRVPESIDDRTGLLDRLRTRLHVEAGKNQAKDQEIQRISENRDAARAETKIVRKWSKIGWTIALIMVAVFALYMAWCWYNSPGFLYQRKIRFQQYGMDSRDY